MRADPLGLLMRSFQDHGDVVRLRFGHMPVFLLAHPDHVRHVLRENHRNYSKRTPSIARVKLVMGEGLVTSDGELWRRQRRIAQPAFHQQRIAGYAGRMTAAAAELLQEWEHAAERDEPLDVAEEMSRLAQRIVGETLLGSDVRGEVGEVGEALGFLLGESRKDLYRVFPRPLWLPTPAQRRVRRARRLLDRVVYRIIARRRAAPEAGDDLLSLLVHARDEETGEAMSDRQLRDEVMTIFLAGHETTANALAWTWLLLARFPEARRRLAAELEQVLGARTPTVADLPYLTYTEMVLRESMRIYPPVWAVSRRAEGDDEIGGYPIPRGALVIISPYVTHRHPAFWEHPERFDPERFAPERHEGRHRYAYFPFGGGPRKCVGEAFAMMEARLVLAMAARRFRLDLEPGHPVEPQPTITLRPLHGLRMRVRRA
jgi:cytochrome P450